MLSRVSSLTPTDAILLVVAQEPDRRIRGRTLLQKKLYFLSVLCDLDYGFAPHYYGPYSSSVSSEIGALVSLGFLEESSKSFVERLGRVQNMRRYDYSLTAAGREVVASYAEWTQPYTEALRRINTPPISHDANLLSVAAKVHLIVSQLGSASVDDIRRRAGELGWDLTEKDVDAVVDYLRQLELVQTTRAASAC